MLPHLERALRYACKSNSQVGKGQAKRAPALFMVLSPPVLFLNLRNLPILV